MSNIKKEYICKCTKKHKEEYFSGWFKNSPIITLERKKAMLLSESEANRVILMLRGSYDRWEKKEIVNNPFKVISATNGKGVRNLMIVIVEAVPDVVIGNSLIVPMPCGYKEPISVDVLIDDNGDPVRTNLNTCVVTRYNYE